MIDIIITGHGHFAGGIYSALQLIAGEQSNFHVAEFNEPEGTDVLKTRLQGIIEKCGDEILILADLKGGSPFNTAVITKSEITDKKIEVIGGCNLPMLLSAALEAAELSAQEAAACVLDSGRDNIAQYSFVKKEILAEDPSEGI